MHEPHLCRFGASSGKIDANKKELISSFWNRLCKLEAGGISDFSESRVMVAQITPDGNQNMPFQNHQPINKETLCGDLPQSVG